MDPLKKLTFFVGQSALRFFAYLFSLITLFFSALGAVFKHWNHNKFATRNDITMQILFTGVEAVPIISIIGLMIGSIVIIQSTTLAPKFGAGEFLGKIMVIAVIRELAPLVTAFIVIGRSGAALSTYLGNMRVTNELDALEVMGIDPIHVRVMPAVIGFIIAISGLTLLFDAVAIFGGYLFSRIIVSLPFSVFLKMILNELSTLDVLITAIKCLLFGSVISTISCYHAMNIAPSFQEVPQATIKAVVNSIIFSVLLNAIVTVIFYYATISAG
jgi:phospholipid/cholesterol/gamma-HCH transport system permease protein